MVNFSDIEMSTDSMSDKLKQTIRIKRSKVQSDDRGRSVWTAPVEETELELVSTVMLKKLLADDDPTSRDGLDAASRSKDGVLARNLDTDKYEIVDEYELQGVDELSLVSTQALRRILRKDAGDPTSTADETDTEDESGSGGFDPYNSG